MRTSLRHQGLWLDAVVIAAIVAGGTTLAVVTNDPLSDSIAIPGCDTIVPAGSGVSFAVGFHASSTYDNADYPWLTVGPARVDSETASSNAAGPAASSDGVAKDKTLSKPQHHQRK